MLQRLATARTLRAELTGEGEWHGEPLRQVVRLLYQRPDRLRLEVEAPPARYELGITDREYVLYHPVERQVLRGSLEAPPRPRWDGFASPVGSFLALLAPEAADRAALAATLLPRLRALAGTRLDGEPLQRLCGRAAFGAVVEFWVRADGCPRRITLSLPERGGQRGPLAYRIDVLAIDEPLDPGSFRVKVPAATADVWTNGRVDEGTRGRVDGGRVAAKRVDGRVDEGRAGAAAKSSIRPLVHSSTLPGLAQLRERAARSPRSAPLQLRIAAACEELGQAQAAVAALKKAVALDPGPTTVNRAWEIAVAMNQWKTALGFRLSAAERLGEDLLDTAEGEEVTLVEVARAARLTKSVIEVVERLLPHSRAPWRRLAQLVSLHVAANEAERATDHWLAVIEPGGDQVPFTLARAAATVEAAAELGWPEWSWPEGLRPRIVAGLRRAEPWLLRALDELSGGGIGQGPWISAALPRLYLAAGAVGDAARLLRGMDESDVERDLVVAVAVGLRRAGSAEDADRLLRRALLAVVERDPVHYEGVVELLQVPECAALLRPALKQLAAADRGADPLASAHWLFLAAEWESAAAAYERYLASPEGALEAAPASTRHAAAVLGALSARRAGAAAAHGVGARLDGLVRQAAVEMPFAEVEYASQQTFAFPVLDAARGTRVFPFLIDAAAYAAPQAAWSWLARAGGAPEELDEATLRALLARILVSRGNRAPGEVTPGELALALARLGRHPAAAAPLVEALGSRPDDRLAALARDLVAGMAEPGPLLNGLKEAVERRPDWPAGNAALAEAFRAGGDPAAARALLSAAATRTKAPALYRQLAGVEWQSGRPAEALAVLREGLTIAPDDRELRRAAAWQLGETGSPSEARAAWAAFAASMPEANATDAPAIARGLRAAGDPAGGLQFLEARFRAAVKAGEEEAAAFRALFAAELLAQGMPLKALALYRRLVDAAKDRAFDPENADDGGRPEGWALVARGLEAAGQRRAARRAWCAALLRGVAGTAGLEALLRLAAAEGTVADTLDLVRRALPGEPGDAEELWGVCDSLLPPGAEGGQGAELRLKSVALPAGDPVPHATPAARLACGGLAALASTGGREEESACWRRWAEALDLIGAGSGPAHPADLRRAASLSPDSPCLAVAQAVSRLAVAREGRHGLAPFGLIPDPSGFVEALDRSRRAGSGLQRCPVCGPGLRELAAVHPDVLQQWLIRHGDHAGAQLVGGTLLLRLAEQSPGHAPGAETALRRAVALAPRLTAAWERLRDLYRLMPNAASGRANGLLEAAAKVAEQRPLDGRSLLVLAEAQSLAGRHADAGPTRQRAMAILPPGTRVSTPGIRPERAGNEPEAVFLRVISYLRQRDGQPVRWFTAEIPAVLGIHGAVTSVARGGR